MIQDLYTILNERPSDAAAIDALHELAFGPGRFARAASILREGTIHDPTLSFVALHGDEMIGSVRLTAIRIGDRPALLLGPLAVIPEWKGRGAGKALMRISVAAAKAAGHQVILLVGDEPYYGLFGFRPLDPYRITLPGPTDPARTLVCPLVDGALDGLAGMATKA